ncbi:MAG TPA: hypothetical protein VK858_18165 [Longimicrobiales bacterium]|nr:hypothetical protein [Longimicrobiales bacterium]
MSTERRSLGSILLDLGRIQPEDSKRALDYQREHGGYFGEALVALGVLTQDEIEWGLASQYDLPHVFPDPAAVDPDAAALVSPEWALANLTLPVMRAAGTLTVLVDSPLRTEPAEALAERLGMGLQLALAAPTQIREVIRQVYARGTARHEEGPSLPCSLEEALSRVAAAGAQRFGISVRGSRAGFWWDDGGTVHRRPLDARWSGVLDERVSTVLSALDVDDSPTVLEATLDLDGVATPVEVRFLADQGGRELLFRPLMDEDSPVHRFNPPPPGVVTEVRLLARSGAARFIVTGEPGPVAAEVLPHLPELFFDRSWRSVHVRDGEGGGEGFAVDLSAGGEATPGERLEALRAFHFDVVTVALEGGPGTWLNGALDVASVVFVLWNDADDTGPAAAAGVRWRLHLARADGDHIEWTLDPLDR